MNAVRRFLSGSVGVHLAAFRRERRPQLAALALLVGLAACGAALAFHAGVEALQRLWLGTDTAGFLAAASAAPWWRVMAGPVLGGLAVGLFLTVFLPNQRTSSIADVVEARSTGSADRLAFWPGVASAVATVVSLGAGASAGREGPMVHLGGTIATSLGNRFRLPPDGARTLIAAGAAGAIAASFNTPLAGVLFAHEVILGHYALGAFVPTVIAAAAAVVPYRALHGDVSAFAMPDVAVASLAEFPAFALLGVAAGAAAVLFQWTLVGTDLAARRLPLPLWARPVLGGVVVGAMGLAFPQVLGIGYAAVDAALRSDMAVPLLLALIAAKIVATAVTLASRFGGGIVFPSLYVGAMTGGAFGRIASSLVPSLASSHPVYAVLGMAAVGSAMLGAPISTAVMVFELTGGFQLSIALLLCVAMANATTHALHGRSLIDWQLEMRGILLRDGAHRHTMRALKVERFMSPLVTPAPLPEDYPRGTVLHPGDSLARALKLFDFTRAAEIAVVDPAAPDRMIAWATHVEALRIYNEALVAEAAERVR
ncbi:chloride channel protein [Oharaeibacter diazotrophicus]|uniref:CIC family chloride channel protein n=1 Tax=Oharaeibacter diazotrophicus TaxID=1920512 RepID=A0A4R6RH24_9HYPH|nr:chloride channel protein [Oharaeibacter diazotrophicus]TDP85564.1 CIC family chloride channel protein [Oharaeibacter diazotrophicus]BBE74535.1 H(+)/Cl(-) exchange transporter ClcA [Pleomorphomonas sp. SM30]GLS75766.1 chloride channel protein [Oharaeibacter diazotrophicus]